MKKLTQKLVLSVVTMALVVVALGTSTFAWFTLQNTAVIGQFEADVTAGEGIEVSLGSWVQIAGESTPADTSDDVYEAQLLPGSTWYTSIPGSVIQNRLSAMYGSSLTLTDVTSTNGRVMQKRAADGQLSSVGALEGKYIQFPLWFRSASANTITLENLVISGTETKTWTVDSAFVGANNNDFAGATSFVSGDTMKVAAWTAARVSIFNQAGTLGKVYQREAVTGTSFADTVYNSDVLPSVSYAADEQFGAASYYSAKTGGMTIAAPAANIIPDAVKLASTGDITDDPDNLPINESVLVLAQTGGVGYYQGNIVVRVWIEGWDADLFDAIFTTKLYVSMRFGVA